MPFTHVTGLLVLQRGDNITTHILNYGSAIEAIRVRIFAGHSGALLSDTGDVKVPSRMTTASSFLLPSAEECWIEVETSSESIVPICYFVHPAVPVQIISLYKGGDFAAFDPAGKRLW